MSTKKTELNLQFFNRKAGVKLEESDDGRIMQGLATLYDFTTDLYWFTMSIDKKAFKDAIERGDEVVSVINHNLDLLIGRTPNTLELDWNRKDGLYTRTQLPKHYLGQMVDEALDRGDFNQMSISFGILEEVVTREEGKAPHYHVTKAELYDISVVTFAQIPETSVEVVQGSFGSKADNEILFRELARRHGDDEKIDQSLADVVEIHRLRHEHKKKLFGR